MSTGNKFVDDQIASAAALLNAQWKSGQRAQQPENDLHPNSQALQFRIKLMEDRCDTIEAILKRNGFMR